MNFALPMKMLALSTVLSSAAFCGTGAEAAPRAIGVLARSMSPTVARCLMKRQPEFVTTWLKTLPGSSRERDLVRRNEVEFFACFGNDHGESISWRGEYDVVLMRASLVRAFLQSRRSELPTDAPAGLGNPSWFERDQALNPSDKGSATAILANEIAYCLIRKNWTNVRTIILAVDPEIERRDFQIVHIVERAKKRENAIVQAELTRMIPSIAGCVPAGSRLSIDRTRLRAMVEEAAFHAIDTFPVEHASATPASLRR